MAKIVKHGFSHRFTHGAFKYSTDVPAGTRVEPIADEPGKFFVAEFHKLEPFARHDAIYYGIRVDISNVEER